MPSAPPDSDVARFRTDLTALIGTKTDRIALAISGGPDSLALLLLTHAAGFDCAAATVDHGLRAEGAQEAATVSVICAEIDVPHQILTLGPPTKGNVSDWARDARYTALTQWAVADGFAHLLTAHHADDQLETVIMRLNRGSGVAGLAGIRAKRGMVARPLLGWRKNDLVALVQACGITAVDDPTNHDHQFDRARLRKALAGADWLDPVAATHSAAALAQAEEALNWAAKAYFNRRSGEQSGTLSLDPSDLPAELLRRIILLCLRRIVPGADPRGDGIDRLISALHRGQTVTLAGVKCAGGAFWLFSPAPARRTI